MGDVEEAVAALQDVGLTQYEAQCFVALTRLPQGTAKQISQVADVPRSRVYDAVERLHRRGLVDVQGSEPREYRAVSVSTALDGLRSEYDERIDEVDRLLDGIEAAQSLEEKGVWAIAEHTHVSERIVALLEDATDEVHLLIAVDTAFEEAVISELNAAAARGVEIRIEVPTGAVRERLRRDVPEADVIVESTLERNERLENKWPGQLLMVDRHSILASGIEETDLPDVTRETAVWSSGVDHGFAAWIQELLIDRIERRNGK